jgi:DNA-binding CsgD family transcriptional regulator
VYAARAEAAWLAGDLDAARQAARAGYELALPTTDPHLLAELACWRRRLGDLDHPPENMQGPFALEVRGRWADAWAAWLGLGCAYEAALASMQGGETAVREALRSVERLGATRAAEAIIRDLRSRGERRIPRRSRASTRANMAGLTQREVEVLELLAEGLRDAEIAERLTVSRRTVGHHVSAVLRKLDVRSRTEAARALSPKR